MIEALDLSLKTISHLELSDTRCKDDGKQYKTTKPALYNQSPEFKSDRWGEQDVLCYSIQPWNPTTSDIVQDFDEVTTQEWLWAIVRAHPPTNENPGAYKACWIAKHSYGRHVPIFLAN